MKLSRWEDAKTRSVKLTLFDLAYCRQRRAASDIVPQTIIGGIHVDAVFVKVVIWLPAMPFRVRQISARYARYKRSLRCRVSAVDVYQVDSVACKHYSRVTTGP